MKLKGIQWGDGECWCFLVTRETFIKVKGQTPSKYDLLPFGKSRYKYKLHPQDIFGWDTGRKIVTLDVEVSE